MRSDWHDANIIQVKESTRTLFDYTYETWDVYLVSQIETFAGYSAQHADFSGDDM